MSLWADYIRETRDDLTVEDSGGFATYRYLPDNTVYIIDIYVVPALRQEGLASALADRIVAEAKARGCVKLLGTVDARCKRPTASIAVLVGYGMQFLRVDGDLLVFAKDI